MSAAAFRVRHIEVVAFLNDTTSLAHDLRGISLNRVHRPFNLEVLLPWGEGLVTLACHSQPSALCCALALAIVFPLRETLLDIFKPSSRYEPLYSPFPRRRDSNWSSEYKMKSLLVHVSFQMRPLKRNLSGCTSHLLVWLSDRFNFLSFFIFQDPSQSPD